MGKGWFKVGRADMGRRLSRVARSLLLTGCVVGAPAEAPGATPKASAPVRPLVVHLAWQAPPECPSSGAVQRRVEKALGRGVFGERAGADRVIYVVVQPLGAESAGDADTSGQDSEAKYRVVFEVEADGKRRGRRELESDTERCSELEEPLSLVLTLMVDAELRLAEESPIDPALPDNAPEAQPPSAVPANPPKKSVRKDKRPPEPRGDAEPRPRLGLGMLGVAGFGLLPSPAFGARVEPRVGVGFGEAAGAGFVELRPSVGYWWPRDAVTEGRGGRLSALDFGGLGCAGQGAWEVCLGAQHLRVEAEPIGLDFGEEQTLNAWLVRGGVGLSHLFGRRFGLTGRISIAVPAERSRFVYSTANQAPEVVHETATVSPLLELGVFFPVAP